MAKPADRNLLFGVLALRMGFVDRDGLITAVQQWAADPEKSLAAVLIERGAIGDGERAVVQMAVESQIRRHGSVQESIAAMAGGAASHGAVDSLAAADPQSCLSSLMSLLGPTTDSEEGPALGRPTSAGGRFRILRPHARGGLGAVFVARDEELGRDVAVKEIQAEYAGNPDLRTRFVLEAEITGGLEHPGIVPVYGLGRHPDGRPFYAMRFIRGQRLMDAIDRFHHPEGPVEPGQRTLALRKLLARFLDVCNAVGYAHSRGVIHRDLKPENVMLGPYGETLLVDWGLAKLVGPAAIGEPARGEEEPAAALEALRPATLDASTPTQFGSVVGTLPYMSPEQAAGLVDQLGPSTDIYGLGATLYAILTGRPPVEGSSAEGLRQAVLRGKFPPPRKLDPRVPPALEAICLKAMALDPSRRYATARELADDVEAWLADEPVRAWREPWRVRAGRWMRRHRPAVAGGLAAVLVALVSLVVGVVLLTAANERERDAKLLAQERKAEAQENYLGAMQAIDRYFHQVSINPRLREHGLESLQRDLYREAREAYRGFVQRKPEDKQLLAAWGRAHTRLALLTQETESNAKAIEYLETARDVFQELLDQSPDDSEAMGGMAKALLALGGCYQEAGRLEEARGSIEQCRAINERLAEQHPESQEPRVDLGKIHSQLGRIELRLRRLNESAAAYRQAVVVFEGLAREYPDVADYALYLAEDSTFMSVPLREAGRLDEAMEAVRSAEAVQKRLVEKYPNNPDYRAGLARIESNVGDISAAMPAGQADAAAAYRAAIEDRRQLAAAHPTVLEYQRDLAKSHNNLATLFTKQKRWGEAEKEYLAARDVGRRLAAAEPGVPDHQNSVAMALRNLGNVYSEMGRAAEAEAACRQSAEIRRTLVMAHPEVAEYWTGLAATVDNLGTLVRESGRPAETRAYYEYATEVRRRLLRAWPDSAEFTADLALSFARMAMLACQQGQDQDALDFAGRALAAVEKGPAAVRGLPAAGLALWNARTARAETLGRQGRHGEAVLEWDRLLELDLGGARDYARLGRAESLARAGRHQEATKEIATLRPSATGVAPVLYQMAAIQSVASTAAARDPSLSPPERERLAREDADLAMQVLLELEKEGYFKDPQQVRRLAVDPDLEPLRSREDFRRLRERLSDGRSW